MDAREAARSASPSSCGSPTSTRRTPGSPPEQQQQLDVASPELGEEVIVCQAEDTLQASVWNKPSNVAKVSV